jgi:hypothetical protein
LLSLRVRSSNLHALFHWRFKKCALGIALFFLAITSLVRAQDGKDLDNYRFRVEGNWWLSSPSGYFGARGNNSYFDINHDFGFGSYSTFTGKIDWRFARKHHLLFSLAPINNTRTVTLNRTIDFQGETFNFGAVVSARLRNLTFSPGYQYDIIRRDHGYLGVEIDFNLLDTEATLKAAASVNGLGSSQSASKSFFAPLPAFGPTARWYPLHNSNRLSLEGAFSGMSFFGYGSFLKARGNVGVGLTDHLALRAGYALGSRLSVHGTSDQIAVQIAQRGPTAGIEYSWGEAPAKKVHPPNAPPSDWHVDWVPIYLWFSGLEGNVGALGYVAPVNVSFSQVFSQLNIGYMSILDVRRKRIGLLTDLVFISVSSDQKTTPVGNLYSGFTANAKTFFVDPEAYYRLIEKDRGSVDVVAGARFWRLDNSLDFLQGTASAASVGQTQSWADPVLGARFRLNLKKNWFADLKGDAGGFGVGSQLTYQIYSGIGKELKQKYSLLLGYRYLYVDYTNGGFLYGIRMNGMLAGFNVRFK